MALVANFLMAPLIAWTLCRLFPLDPDYESGLLLLGGAAGAPFLPKLAQRARANEALAITLMMLLVVGTVAFLPLVMPFILPGLRARPLDIAFPLVVLIVAPLAAGMLLRGLWEPAARRAEPFLRHLSDLCLIVFVVVIVGTHLGALWSVLGSGAILTAMVFVLLSGGAAYALGGPDLATRRITALATGQRNIAAAIVSAGVSFPDQPRTLVMILVTDVVALVILFAAVRRFRNTPGSTEGDAAGQPAAHNPAIAASAGAPVSIPATLPDQSPASQEGAGR
jgi:BASS family bile acid:Na+ symporter